MRRPRNPFDTGIQAFPWLAAQVAITLGGSGAANGSGWYQARCPNHDDHRFSLSLKNTSRGLIAKCFVCQNAAAVEASIRAAMDGWPPVTCAPSPARPPLTPADLARIITRIRAESAPIAGTLVEHYLRRRKITLELPPTLLYHPALYHKESGTTGPAMVALVPAANGDPVPALHRTWLAADGASKANLAPVRKSLGAITGHAVHLGRASPRLIVGEGIETTLSALQMWGPSFDAWATLSTSGMASVVIPDSVTGVIIASDNDTAGFRASRDLHHRLNRERPTLKVSRCVPRDGLNDFNDALMARVAA